MKELLGSSYFEINAAHVNLQLGNANSDAFFVSTKDDVIQQVPEHAQLTPVGTQEKPEEKTALDALIRQANECVQGHNSEAMGWGKDVPQVKNVWGLDPQGQIHKIFVLAVTQCISKTEVQTNYGQRLKYASCYHAKNNQPMDEHFTSTRGLNSLFAALSAGNLSTSEYNHTPAMSFGVYQKDEAGVACVGNLADLVNSANADPKIDHFTQLTFQTRLQKDCHCLKGKTAGILWERNCSSTRPQTTP
jgi:hypothetical protein